MKASKRQILVALVVGGALLGAGRADAWVAVRAAPIARGVAFGVTAAAVAGAVSSSYYAPPPSTTVVVQQPAPAPAPAAPAATGTVITTLPSGCVSSGGRYQCGSTWYQPYFGANGVYYQVVAP
jgi:hypothetical protein